MANKHINDKPFLIDFALTFKCNFNCKHCFIQDKSKSDMSFLTVKKIFNQIYENYNNNLFFVLSGGETFLRKDIFKIFDFLTKKGFNFSISTNGSFITEGIAKKLSKFNVSYIQISVDELKSHYIRGNYTSQKIIENAISILNKNNIDVLVATVVLNKNLDEIPAINDFCRDMDVKRHRLIRYKPIKMDLSPDKRQMISLIKGLKSKKNIEIDEAFPYLFKKIIEKKNIQNCGAGKGFFSVDPNGMLYCCPHWYVLEKSRIADFFLLGDLKRDRLKSLVRSEKLHNIRNFDYTKIKGHCVECKYLKLCKGGCRIVSIYGGDLYKSDPLCA